MAGFLSEYCGLASSSKCNCKKRVGYAIKNRRLNPANLEYSELETLESRKYTQAMEEIDAQSQVFASLPYYRSPQTVRDFLNKVLHSEDMAALINPRV